MPLSSPEVFISHAHRDQTVAGLVCQALEQQHIRCWIAPRDIGVGEIWDDALVRGISDSRIVILIFSSGTNESKHVKREVHMAFEKGKTVIPFRVEDVKPEGGLEYMMVGVQWLDAVVPPLDRHLKALADRVTAILATVPAPALQSEAEPGTAEKPCESAPPKEPVLEPQPKHWIQSSWTWRIPSGLRTPGAMAALAVLFLVIGAGTVWKYDRPSSGHRSHHIQPSDTATASADASGSEPEADAGATDEQQADEEESRPARGRRSEAKMKPSRPERRAADDRDDGVTIDMDDRASGKKPLAPADHQGEVESATRSRDGRTRGAGGSTMTISFSVVPSGGQRHTQHGQGEIDSSTNTQDGRPSGGGVAIRVNGASAGTQVRIMPGNKQGEVVIQVLTPDGRAMVSTKQ